MKKPRKILEALGYSLPIQLLALQVRKYKLLLLFWLIVLGMISGSIGSGYGLTYLFLEPEYMGKESFASILLTGATLGTFVFAYLITLYINESYRYSFIALERQPFLTFSLNNAILPVLLLGLYFYRFTSFHIDTQGGFNEVVFEKILALSAGFGITMVLFGSYFFATGRRGLFQSLGDGLERELEKARGTTNKKVLFTKAKESLRSIHRVDHYFMIPFGLTRVQNRVRDFRQVVNGLSKHHGRLLLFQIGIFILIALLGILEENRHFQIPAGASLLLVMSLLMMIAGAVTFWYRKLGVVPFLFAAALFYVVDTQEALHDKHHALGLDYDTAPAAYTEERLRDLGCPVNYVEDRAYHTAMLDRWAARHRMKYGPEMKPKAVLVTATGGGLRSAFWTYLVLQQLDSTTNGIFTDNIRLFSGASGGMFGTAYFRELKLRQERGEPVRLYDPVYQHNLTKDLLNRIAYRNFTEVFLPGLEVEIDGKIYDKDRGYAFDQELSHNLPELKGRRLGDYQKWEAQGFIPPLILTPTITNQGRKLFISSSPASFLARGSEITEQYVSKASGIEFRRMFADQHADSLHFVSALRMNATFPLVLPQVTLPSEPEMFVMDAGAIDNYGVTTAVQYLFEFREWFAKNSDGVLIVQIRDNKRLDPIQDVAEKGFINRTFSPLGRGYKSMVESREMAYDRLLEAAGEWFDGKLEIVSFEYPKETSDKPASISFHLTEREKQSILRSLSHDHNQSSLEIIRRYYEADRLIAQRFALSQGE